ncbi:MAG: PmoA family protein [Tagaea sp.]|nr:PmoA family protein [Tagaea sp.]
MTGRFSLDVDDLALPPGAIARTERRILRRDGKPLFGLTQGRMRPYVYPLFTPAGYAVTSESPADHPHHNSLWIAADHVHALVPTKPGRHEAYTYNFYVDETFQGRAAGTLIAAPATMAPASAERAVLTQRVEWRGPVEWGAAQGRTIARETRTIAVACVPGALVLDVESVLTAADWALELGPTRHAYFNFRVADSMVVAMGGRVRDDRGRVGGAAIGDVGARWVAFDGPVGGGARAGIVAVPDPAEADRTSWFVADWGVVSVGSFRHEARTIPAGAPLRTRLRYVVHDGAADDAAIAAWAAGFPAP